MIVYHSRTGTLHHNSAHWHKLCTVVLNSWLQGLALGIGAPGVAETHPGMLDCGSLQMCVGSLAAAFRRMLFRNSVASIPRRGVAIKLVDSAGAINSREGHSSMERKVISCVTEACSGKSLWLRKATLGSECEEQWKRFHQPWRVNRRESKGSPSSV